MELDAVERHLIGGSPFIDEVCLVPRAGDDLDGCTAVVVPTASELTAQKVPLPHRRLREAVNGAAASSPRPLRIERVVLHFEPLPRDADGALEREAIAAWACEGLGGAGNGGPDHPAARRFLERLGAALDTPGPYSAAQQFEVDLGMDSLDLVHLRLLLEDEFGVVLPDDQLWRLQTVGDALAHVAAVADPPADPKPAEYTWAARLRTPPAVSLDERFNMKRRGGNLAAAGLGMRIVTLLSKLAFRTEFLHAERLPKEGPFLLCPTHQSLIDSPLIYGAFPYGLIHRTVFIAHGPYFNSGPLSLLVRRGRLILTGEGGRVAESLQLAWDALQRGWNVAIFPEGNCSYTGRIMEARPGVGLLACEAQVPIVPVLYEGSSGTNSPLNPGFHFTKIRIVVGEPIPPPAPRTFTRADYQAHADRWREAVEALQSLRSSP